MSCGRKLLLRPHVEPLYAHAFLMVMVPGYTG